MTRGKRCIIVTFVRMSYVATRRSKALDPVVPSRARAAESPRNSSRQRGHRVDYTGQVLQRPRGLLREQPWTLLGAALQRKLFMNRPLKELSRGLFWCSFQVPDQVAILVPWSQKSPR